MQCLLVTQLQHTPALKICCFSSGVSARLFKALTPSDSGVNATDMTAEVIHFRRQKCGARVGFEAGVHVIPTSANKRRRYVGSGRALRVSLNPIESRPISSDIAPERDRMSCFPDLIRSHVISSDLMKPSTRTPAQEISSRPPESAVAAYARKGESIPRPYFPAVTKSGESQATSLSRKSSKMGNRVSLQVTGSVSDRCAIEKISRERVPPNSFLTNLRRSCHHTSSPLVPPCLDFVCSSVLPITGLLVNRFTD